MKAFLICPVRGADESAVQPFVQALEKDGWDVHWPPRDTNQNDPVGFQICQENYRAIDKADVVFVVYDEKSRGSLFDMGVAFSLFKPICVLNLDDIKCTDTKSFGNMIRHWHGLSHNLIAVANEKRRARKAMKAVKDD